MKVRIKSVCEKCQQDQLTEVDITPLQLAPVNRANISPVTNVFVYRITSDAIKKYLIDKAQMYAPTVKMEVVPRFIQKKRRRPGEVNGGYASLRIAFSEQAILKNDQNGWFGKIGENSSNPRIIKSIFQNFIQLFKYDRDELKKIRENYKLVEELEETLGITEAYLDDLIMFAMPRAITTVDKNTWVMFSAAAEKIIPEMLTVAATGEDPGRVVIQDVTQISKDSVEYLVHVYPDKIVSEDPSVRRILLGEEKIKTK